MKGLTSFASLVTLVAAAASGAGAVHTGFAPAGAETPVSTPAAPVPLLETYWAIEAIVDGDAVVDVPDQFGAHLTFQADGRMAGYAICNSLSGQVSIDTATIESAGVAMTRRACVGVNSQLEPLIGAALDSGTVAYQIRGETLTMIRRDGGPGLLLRVGTPPAATADPSRQPSLLDTHWRIDSIFHLDANLQLPGEPEAYLVLRGDGRVQGYDMCNSYSGTVVVTAEQVIFSEMVWTARTCPGIGEHNQLLSSLISRFLADPDPAGYWLREYEGSYYLGRNVGTRFETGLTLRAEPPASSD